MKSNYRKIGDFINQVKEKNKDNLYFELLGINIDKFFMPSVANIHGVDLSKYKVVRKDQFACNRMHVGRDYRIPISLSRRDEPFLVSPAYDVFEIKDTSILLPEYLMMWFSRKEFDRNAWFYTDADVRGGLPWSSFCEIELPIPSIEKQREIVREYNIIVNRIALNELLIQKLEETAQAIYKQWFVDFDFPSEALAKDGVSQPYKSSGGKMVWCDELDKEIPEGWEVKKLTTICDKIGSGSTPKGGKDSYHNVGTSLIRSLNVHDFTFLYENLALINDDQAKKLNGVSVLKNDVLLNITGASVARCTIVPENVLPARVNQHVSIIRLSKKYSFCYYLLCFLCSTDCKKELVGLSDSGSTRQAVTKSEIEDLNILVPKGEPIEYFEKNVGHFFLKKEKISKETQKLKEVKELVLSKMTKVEIEKNVIIEN